MLRIRGLFDELHPGEVDPGVVRIFLNDAQGKTLVGHAWRLNPGLRMILYENYEDHVPGGVGRGYKAGVVTLTFEHSEKDSDKGFTVEQAKKEWEGLFGRPPKFVELEQSSNLIKNADPG